MTLTPLHRLVVLVLGAWLVVAPLTACANWGEQTAADLAALELAKDDQAMIATILGDSLNTPSSPPLGPAATYDDSPAPAAEKIVLNDPQRLHRDSIGVSHLGQQPDPQQVIAGSAPLYQ